MKAKKLEYPQESHAEQRESLKLWLPRTEIFLPDTDLQHSSRSYR